MATIVIDANVMIAAVLGRSLPLIVGLTERTAVVAPLQQFAEAHEVLSRFGLQQSPGIAAILELVEPLAPEIYAPFEDHARARLGERGQSDWPMLAAALALSAELWSRDRDLFGTGVGVWSTRNIKFAGAEAA